MPRSNGGCTPFPGRVPEGDVVTTPPAHAPLSLRAHLINWVFTPLYLLFLFSLAAGYIAAVGLSNRPYDLLLIERGRQLAARLDAGRPHELARVLVQARETGLRGAVFSVRGTRLAGDPALPMPRAIDLADGAPHLHDVRVGQSRVRLLTLKMRTPGHVLQVAEPTDERQSLSRRILGYIVLPQVLIILVVGLAMWVGLRRGLAPLERLRRQLAGRPREDPRPLDEGAAPAEVRPFIHEINQLLQRLGQSLESQRRFVADAAHQLRTPFAGLRAQAELARREAPAGPLQVSLDRICQGATRCSRLVNQLLALARNEPQRLATDQGTVLDLHRLARQAALRWAPEALAQGIDLGFEAQARQLPVRGNEDALDDLLDNLLDNAVRYTPAGGHVTVVLGYGGDDGGGAWLRVEDDGPGIPQAMHDKVFERFWRMPGNRQPGSGLGLAIVAEVALRHDALVRLEPGIQGRGVALVVRFPHHAMPMRAGLQN
ncbi:MAG TPA: ATP-binding protein [Thiobacillaceae bacterium]|nr:ATP-binding protein [Thiobacillaceae bacterium]HNU63879.1 ATP-binding protein [Thiobacillaceae bacterium]